MTRLPRDAGTVNPVITFPFYYTPGDCGGERAREIRSLFSSLFFFSFRFVPSSREDNALFFSTAAGFSQLSRSPRKPSRPIAGVLIYTSIILKDRWLGVTRRLIIFHSGGGRNMVMIMIIIRIWLSRFDDKDEARPQVISRPSPAIDYIFYHPGYNKTIIQN